MKKSVLTCFAYATTMSTVVFMSSSLFAVTAVAVNASLDESHLEGQFSESTFDYNLNPPRFARVDSPWTEPNLGERYIVDELANTFYQGVLQTATIDIDISDNGESWHSLYRGEQLQSTAELHQFELEKIASQYLRLLSNAHMTQTWNSLTDVQL